MHVVTAVTTPQPAIPEQPIESLATKSIFELLVQLHPLEERYCRNNEQEQLVKLLGAEIIRRVRRRCDALQMECPLAY